MNGHPELDAGSMANLAILEFSEYLDTLDDTTRESVFSVGLFDRFRGREPEFSSIGKKWQLLSDPKGRGYLHNQQYCVEMIANDLEDILDANPGLYESTSCHGSSISELSNLSRHVEQSLDRVAEKLPVMKLNIAYVEKGELSLYTRLIDQLTRDKTFRLSMDEILNLAVQAIDDFPTAKRACRRLFKTILQRSEPNIRETLARHLPPRCLSLLNDEATIQNANRMFRPQRREREVQHMMPNHQS